MRMGSRIAKISASIEGSNIPLAIGARGLVVDSVPDSALRHGLRRSPVVKVPMQLGLALDGRRRKRLGQHPKPTLFAMMHTG